MNKTVLALAAALTIAAAPICAEITQLNTTVTAYDNYDNEVTVSQTITTERYDWFQREHLEANLLKAFGAVYGLVGVGALALAYEHYTALKGLPQDVHTIGQKYEAMQDGVVGTGITALGLLLYAFGHQITPQQ